MKKTMQKTVSVLLVILLLLGLSACGNTANKPADLWDNATYLQDTTFGEGAKTLTVVVKAEEKSVTFTVNTDKDTVGAALFEHNLIDGEEAEYGLYLKVVNGITADYDVDQSYWAFYIGNDYAMSGVDSTEITEGVTYQLVYTK